LNRVIGYVDGFNLYYGLRERGWKRYYWLDPHRLIQGVIAPDHRLVSVKYFTARVRGPDDKRQRQGAYLDALNAQSEAEIIYGKFYRKQRRCSACGAEWTTHEEKMTDSAIASNLVADAFREEFDTAFLVGGDTDIVPAIKMVRRHFPLKRIVAWFPPARRNEEVAQACHDSGAVNGDHLAAAQMAERVEVQEGVFVTRPTAWSRSPPERPPSATT
jgi:uncharacterized LabA/DUF88 family protein